MRVEKDDITRYKMRELKRDITRIFLVIAASIIMAINIKSFVRAGNLIPGGFTGVSLLIMEVAKKYFDISLSYAVINLLFNSVPVIISFKVIGKKFTIYSCIMILTSSLLTDILPVYPITYDVLLISIFGGIVNGTAISMCLFADATSGGTDFIAIFLSEKFGVDAWNYILIANAIVLLVAGGLFGWDKALYSIIFQFTSTEVLHVCYKRYKRNTLFIITNSPEEVVKIIYRYTGHGATNIAGIGTHENKPRTLIYSVVSSDQVKKVISKVKEVDESVFVNVVKTEQLDGNFYVKPND